MTFTQNQHNMEDTASDSKSASKQDVGSISPTESESAVSPLRAEDVELEGQEDPKNWKPLPKCMFLRPPLIKPSSEVDIANCYRAVHHTGRIDLWYCRLQFERPDTRFARDCEGLQHQRLGL